MIHGLSEKRRMPRLGKIRLGVMVHEAGKTPYPRATDHFVCPEEVQKVHGKTPKELPILLPVDAPEVVFPQEYKMYKSAGLWCAGDGQRARRWDDLGNLKEMVCPCPYLENGECGPVATLNFLLPDVAGVGVWQLVTSNTRSIVSINSALETFGRTFGGLAGIPFLLKLDLEPIQRFDEKSQKMVKQKLHVLRLDSPYTLRQIVEWRQKVGKSVEALMPASEEDDADRPALPVAGNGEPTRAAGDPSAAPAREASGSGSDTAAAPTGPTVKSTEPAPAAPDGRVSAPKTGGDEEWTIERCFRAAQDTLGLTAKAYELYLKGAFGMTPEQVSPKILKEQASLLREAAGAPAKAEALKRAMIAAANKASRHLNGK